MKNQAFKEFDKFSWDSRAEKMVELYKEVSKQ